jgi:hypothetical protein
VTRPNRRHILVGLFGAVPALALALPTLDAEARRTRKSRKCQGCGRGVRPCKPRLKCYSWQGNTFCVTSASIVCRGEPAIPCGTTGDDNEHRVYTKCQGGQTLCCSNANLNGCKPANALCGGGSAASI